MLEEVRHNNEVLAVILRAGFNKPGVSFVTPNEFSQQLAYMQHPAGKVIQPHVHKPVKREITTTFEVLVIQRGKLRADFYTRDQDYLFSKTLRAGDTILLTEAGGHGFEALEELEMLEIKQGPYVEGMDKVRFDPPENFHPQIVEDV